jgi:hypothetical protein
MRHDQLRTQIFYQNDSGSSVKPGQMNEGHTVTQSTSKYLTVTRTILIKEGNEDQAARIMLRGRGRNKKNASMRLYDRAPLQ